MIKTITDWKNQLTEYKQLVANYENRGIENLGLEDTEYYGAYLGKVELLEAIIELIEAKHKKAESQFREFEKLHEQAVAEKDMHMASHYRATLIGMSKIINSYEN